MSNIIRRLVREILNEDAYKRETGKRYTADIEQVRDAVDKEGYFLHFTDTPKIGFNPKSTYVPGVYFYPNTREIYDGFFREVHGAYRGAGRAARYVYLVKLKPDLNIIEGTEINERIVGVMREAMQPILSAGLDDSLLQDPKMASRFKSWHVDRTRGLLSGVDLKFPTVEELKSSGMLDKMVKNFNELSEIHQMLKNRPRMTKEAQKEEFLETYNDRLSQLMGQFGFSLRLKSLDAEDIRSHLKELESILSSGGGALERRTNKYVLDIDRLTYSLSGQYGVSMQGVNLEAGKRTGGIGPATIALRSITPAILSYAQHIAESMNLQGIPSHLAWLYSPGGPVELSLKSGGTVTLGELKQRCITTLESALGSSAKSLRAAFKKGDEVGVNIILALAGGADGVNDVGYKTYSTGKELTGGDILRGRGGILGRYEGKQLFLKAPIGDKVEIITMIDRFEGRPESEKIPGSATPDEDEMADPKDRGEFSGSDPRIGALRRRFARKTGEETITGSMSSYKRDTTVPTERWATASKDSRND